LSRKKGDPLKFAGNLRKHFSTLATQKMLNVEKRWKNGGPVIAGFVLMQIPTQDSKSCVTMEDPTTVTLVRTSLVLVMEEVHHKGGFPGDLKGSK
jgi:hypothetical protein